MTHMFDSKDLDMKATIISFQEQLIDLYTDNQVIMQILCKKNYSSVEEINQMREYVKKNSSYVREATKLIKSAKSSLDTQEKDVEVYKRTLGGNITPEDKAYMAEVLNDKERSARLFANVGLIK